jgi:hypothetical protein
VMIMTRQLLPNAIEVSPIRSHDGRAPVPIPKRSASLRATSTPHRWTV